MKQLWAPWRMKYIEGSKDNSCIFCDLPKESQDKENLILSRGELAFVIMNLYPYNNGHVMIAPYSHVPSLSKLEKETLVEMTLLTQKTVAIIEELFKPEGLNVGMNIGKTAGAGFDGHVHMHVVPRWNGDTNFMPVLADTRVISEHLLSTYEKLSPYYKT